MHEFFTGFDYLSFPTHLSTIPPVYHHTIQLLDSQFHLDFHGSSTVASLPLCAFSHLYLLIHGAFTGPVLLLLLLDLGGGLGVRLQLVLVRRQELLLLALLHEEEAQQLDFITFLSLTILPNLNFTPNTFLYLFFSMFLGLFGF